MPTFKVQNVEEEAEEQLEVQEENEGNKEFQST